jgi:hypothetical protein
MRVHGRRHFFIHIFFYFLPAICHEYLSVNNVINFFLEPYKGGPVYGAKHQKIFVSAVRPEKRGCTR